MVVLCMVIWHILPLLLIIAHMAAPSESFGPVVVPDEVRAYDPSKHVFPKEYEGHLESLMISKEEIVNRCRDLAQWIHRDYAGQRPVLLCVLKGASPFYQHLLEALQDLKQGYYMEFLRASSYHGTSSTGSVSLSGGLKVEELRGKRVIVVEDIVDTGTTLSHLIPILQKDGNPKSIEVCTLLSKRLDKPASYVAKYIGFSIPNHFIVGYGLDYNELYRDLRDIWVISQKGIDFDASSLH